MIPKAVCAKTQRNSTIKHKKLEFTRSSHKCCHSMAEQNQKSASGRESMVISASLVLHMLQQRGFIDKDFVSLTGLMEVKICLLLKMYNTSRRHLSLCGSLEQSISHQTTLHDFVCISTIELCRTVNEKSVEFCFKTVLNVANSTSKSLSYIQPHL